MPQGCGGIEISVKGLSLSLLFMSQSCGGMEFSVKGLSLSLLFMPQVAAERRLDYYGKIEFNIISYHRFNI
jgi:hypothetical protein